MNIRPFVFGSVAMLIGLLVSSDCLVAGVQKVKNVRNVNVAPRFIQKTDVIRNSPKAGTHVKAKCCEPVYFRVDHHGGYEIRKPGHYILCNDVQLDMNATYAVKIAANDVTLDLNTHTIRGVGDAYPIPNNPAFALAAKKKGEALAHLSQKSDKSLQKLFNAKNASSMSVSGYQVGIEMTPGVQNIEVFNGGIFDVSIGIEARQFGSAPDYVEPFDQIGGPTEYQNHYYHDLTISNLFCRRLSYLFSAPFIPEIAAAAIWINNINGVSIENIYSYGIYAPSPEDFQGSTEAISIHGASVRNAKFLNNSLGGGRSSFNNSIFLEGTFTATEPLCSNILIKDNQCYDMKDIGYYAVIQYTSSSGIHTEGSGATFVDGMTIEDNIVYDIYSEHQTQGMDLIGIQNGVYKNNQVSNIQVNVDYSLNVIADGGYGLAWGMKTTMPTSDPFNTLVVYENNVVSGVTSTSVGTPSYPYAVLQAAIGYWQDYGSSQTSFKNCTAIGCTATAAASLDPPSKTIDCNNIPAVAPDDPAYTLLRARSYGFVAMFGFAQEKQLQFIDCVVRDCTASGGTTGESYGIGYAYADTGSILLDNCTSIANDVGIEFGPQPLWGYGAYFNCPADAGFGGLVDNCIIKNNHIGGINDTVQSSVFIDNIIEMNGSPPSFAANIMSAAPNTPVTEWDFSGGQTLTTQPKYNLSIQ